MGKLTKASFAAAKRRLGIKKVTKKNIGRIAKAARRGIKRRRKTTRKTTRKTKRRKSNPKGGRSMGRGKSLFRSMSKLAKAGALLTPLIATLVTPADKATKLQWISRRYFGYDTKTGKMELGDLVQGWGPFVAVSAGLKIVSKINGIIRSI